MCIFCCDILCWFSFITCCGCRDIVTRRLVFFPPDAYYDNIEPNEKFSDFYHRLSSKPDSNESDDMKHNPQHSKDIVLQVGHDTNVSTKHKKHEIHTATHISTNPHEMERLNSTEDTILSYDTHHTTTSRKPQTNNRVQNGSILTATTTTTTRTHAPIDCNTFGTFRIKDDDTNLAKFYWHNYELKMNNFSSQYLLTKRGTTIASYHIHHPSSTYTILFSHGNAADIGLMRNHLCRMYQKCSVSIFAYEYSGYGKSSGKASEKNTYADIERAYKYMTNTLGIKPAHIILYGQSLGTCVSIYLATQYPVGGVILHSPLMSGLRVMQHFDKTYWFDIYPVVEQIQQVFAPIFVIHGNRDKEIDVIHGKILSRLAPNAYPPWFVPYAGHNDIEVMFPDVLFKKITTFVKYLTDLEALYQSHDHEEDMLQSSAHGLLTQTEEEDDDDDDDDADDEEDDTDMTRYKQRYARNVAKSVTQKHTDHSLSPPPPQSQLTMSQDRDRMRQITLPSRKLSNTGDEDESVVKTPSVAASLSIKDSNFISISMKEDKSTNKGYETVLTPTMRTIHSQEQSTSELALPTTIDDSHTMTMSTVNNLRAKSRKSRKNIVSQAHSDIDEEEKTEAMRRYNHKKKGKKRRDKKDKKRVQRLLVPTSHHMTDNVKKSFERRNRLFIETSDTSSGLSEDDEVDNNNEDGIGIGGDDSSSSENIDVECVIHNNDNNEQKEGNE